MRKIDLHAYPGTQPWIDCQGPYVGALGTYWKALDGKAKPRSSPSSSRRRRCCLVALDLIHHLATPPCSNDYVARCASAKRDSQAGAQSSRPRAATASTTSATR